MKKKITLLGILFLALSLNTFAQPKKPKSIVMTTASVKTYNEKATLETMNKGELISLYVERIKSLATTLPYIALANKPGVTMDDVGIPNNAENSKLLDVEQESMQAFLNNNSDFQKKILPYADKSTLITCILFYENMLKELHTMNENN